MIYDYMSVIEPRSHDRTTSHIYKKMLEQISKTNVEMFLFESPYNRYTPAPPDGYVALRSNKRRLFVKADLRSNPENVQKLIEQKEYIEMPL